MVEPQINSTGCRLLRRLKTPVQVCNSGREPPAVPPSSRFRYLVLPKSDPLFQYPLQWTAKLQCPSRHTCVNLVRLTVASLYKPQIKDKLQRDCRSTVDLFRIQIQECCTSSGFDLNSTSVAFIFIEYEPPRSAARVLSHTWKTLSRLDLFQAKASCACIRFAISGIQLQFG